MDFLEDLWRWVLGLDWGEFIPTLLATLAGAIVGAWVAVRAVRLAAQLQQRQVYEQRLDEALSALVTEVPARIAELDNYADRLGDWQEYVDSGGDPDTPRPLEPGAYNIGVRIESVRMIARGNDKTVAAEMAGAFASLIGLMPWPQRARLSQLPEKIREWRSGDVGHAEAARAFQVFRTAATFPSGEDPAVPWEAARDDNA